jgi:hypothetical protein
MTPEDHIDTLLDTAASGPVPTPSQNLIARVLADAAIALPHAAPRAAPKPRRRWFAPIGGLRGLLALATCAAMGVVAGAGYADTVLAIPGLDTVLAAFVDPTDSTTPFETLTLLMSES